MRIPTGTAALEAEFRDGVAWVTLNRPERLNALDESIERGMESLWPRLTPQEGVRAVVLQGAGRAFCAGADVGEMSGRPVRSRLGEGDREQARQQERERLTWAFANVVAWRELEVPTVAAVHGVAAGAGLAMACAADFRVAAQGTRMLAAYGRLGLCGDWGMTATLPELVGVGVARRMLILGEELDSETARDVGLVDYVVAPDQLSERAGSLATALADRATVAVGETKRLLRGDRELSRTTREEIEATLRCQETEDYAEALVAFAEKRPARFRGR